MPASLLFPHLIASLNAPMVLAKEIDTFPAALSDEVNLTEMLATSPSVAIATCSLRELGGNNAGGKDPHEHLLIDTARAVQQRVDAGCSAVGVGSAFAVDRCLQKHSAPFSWQFLRDVYSGSFFPSLSS